MSEKHIECPNCGYDISSKERICKYCGSPNPFYDGDKSIVKTGSSSSTFFKNSDEGNKNKGYSLNTSNVNWVFAIILLVICFPIGLIYIILKLFENN